MIQKTFLVMAGGTGGHIFPGLAVAQSLKQKGHKVIWLGADGGMETTLVPKYDVPIETVAMKGVRGKGVLRKLSLPFMLVKAVLSARKIIKKHNIAAVIGFGGYASFPGGFAAKVSGIPVIIHEQNAIAGLVNKTLAKVATKVLFAFPGVFPENKEGLVGNPVREDIANLSSPQERFANRVGPLKILVVGGSLGARALNETIPEALALLKEEKQFEITHQSGKNSVEALKERYKKHNIVANCVEFIDEMPSEYAKADIIICRAGALTISELAACGLGSILIPFPFAVDDHQAANAQYLVKGEAAIFMRQESLTAATLAQELKQLDREKCLALAINARKLGLPDAADKVAQAVLDAVNKDRV